MIDLVGMFDQDLDNTSLDNGSVAFDPLDMAEAIGLAESMMDVDRSDYTNVERLFDGDDEEAHQEAERVSLRDRNNKQNIPNFERMVMGKCNLL